jgi:oxalate decarboxylase/phosphoglucose isomerase-like protein (cupin superfamily)
MNVEPIGSSGRVYAYVMRESGQEASTTFLTPDEAVQQVGFVVHPSGAEVKRHYHLPIERTIVGTPEVLVVRSGRCEMDVYDDDQQLVATHELRTGDVMVMVGGGHGFRMLEDTVLLEVKQGPYYGPDEKAYF